MGVGTLVWLLVGIGASFARPPAAFSPSSSDQVRCPGPAEAPKEILAEPDKYDRITRYLSLVERYCRDPQDALDEIDRFPRTDFKDDREYLAHRRDQMLSQAVNKQSLSGGADWFVRVVRTAAMLHLDRALRKAAGSEIEASHLNWSRQLVRLLEGVDDDATFRRDWYLAVTAHLHRELRFLELDDYLSEARRAFPRDAQILMAWGLMRETQAFQFPKLYALFRRQGASHLRFPSPPEALRDAERSFRDALGRDPGLLEARVHRARVLITLERPDEALRELDAVRTAAAEPRLTYLASLLAGQLLDIAGRVPDAVEAYRTAASLYPACQGATLALSYEVRKSGNRDEALALVRRALTYDSEADCLDPWWLLDFGLGPQADARFDELRTRVRQ